MTKVLVTGGAGFIGGHLVDALVAHGDQVHVIDPLLPQVHPSPPDYLNPKAKYHKSDVAEARVLSKLLPGAEVIFHLGAAVGTAQSMYQVDGYVRENSLGTAKLLQALIDRKLRPRRLVVASSNTIYGEGRYRCAKCGPIAPGLRSEEQLLKHDWAVHCPICGAPAQPAPTEEGKPLDPSTVYAMTKYDEEKLSLMIGEAYGIPTVACRFFNTYGPRQQLHNPYTGLTAIFLNQIRNGHAPIVYEDGFQTRDFVNVHDIVRGLLLAMERREAVGHAINLGTGKGTSVREVARLLMDLEARELPLNTPNKYRPG
ncbi:MAG: NAD-dependent epimerase/dehydratase family protein, partial [Euryarchaeota archaeon]|nr:NAD-dependent epimerase/dehydratase family protein [Euryarchaeota archaeon]